MEDITDAHGEGGGDQLDARPQPPKLESGQETPSRLKSEMISDRYKMTHPKRGTAIIFNNKDFHPSTGMASREGTDVDADAMYELLSKLGFESIQMHKNTSVSKMKDVLSKVSLADHTHSDCFVCVLLSHGEEGYVFGCDGKVSVDQLVDYFKGHKCKSLAGKPKLFFIQACRGTGLDQGVDVSDSLGEDEEVPVLYRIPTEADFLMVYSVMPGYFAWRNSARGSWFIQAIVDIFTKHSKELDVLTMMTRVNKKVALDFQSNSSQAHMKNQKQVPCFTSMLTKDLYFF